ncbi:hypothetical protein DPMN_182806 [Dreissena polymorpha]|uniref:Caspase family p10 domain-containing protein n=1 Tax=Dreissena polymorpha TaxID=45954 RepID=A0A9D4I6H5_DREPO|nr:hypothetical protein DPMN_182806 [Dreissena polymorpha]
MAGKPKLFFLQAGQGHDKMEAGEVPERDAPEPLKDVEVLPNEADFLLGYATVPGYVTFRTKNEQRGIILTERPPICIHIPLDCGLFYYTLSYPERERERETTVSYPERERERERVSRKPEPRDISMI